MSNTTKSSKKTSDQKHHKSATTTSNTKMVLKTDNGVQPLKKEDEFYFSPILLVGLFITALGAGFLLPGTNTPAFEIWSMILAGIIVSIAGAVQQIKHYQMKKHKDAKKIPHKTSSN